MNKILFFTNLIYRNGSIFVRVSLSDFCLILLYRTLSLAAENEYCSGIETWHGETDIASVVNQAGNWDDISTNESLMFDSDNNTFWQSGQNSGNLKVIEFKFNVSY